MRINIAIAGGPCTGKSTLAKLLFAELKIAGLDYDLVDEEYRKLKREFGHFRSPFDRFYIWRQQEREEFRSMALDGFITESPLFQYYVHARQYASEPRDELAVRELLRMCLEIKDRYQLIIIAEDPFEIPYKKDQCRESDEAWARQRHNLIRSFIEHFWPEKLLLVKGDAKERVAQVIKKLEEMRKTAEK